mgnify:CR=1 FL=1|tara:strand:- start:372 stop:1013 length:642 start_codon:yes stop_codon:yes gene_type:complete
MQDNFDLKGYLRHGNKLLNENIGGYVDLMPLREEESDMTTIELDMAWDSSNPEEDAAAKAAFDQYGIEVSGDSGRPGTYEVTGRKEDILAYLRSEFYEMDEEDIQQYYPELLNGDMSEGEPDGEQYDGKYDAKSGPTITSELEKPKSIYVTDDSEDEKGFIVPGDDDEEFVDGFEETRDNAQRAFVDAIESLRMMSFEDDDIIDMFKTAFNAK